MAYILQMRIERFFKKELKALRTTQGTYHSIWWKWRLGSYIGSLPCCCDKCLTKDAEGRRGLLWLRVLREPLRWGWYGSRSRVGHLCPQSEEHCSQFLHLVLFYCPGPHERLLLTFRIDLLTPWILI